ncbi:MAG TPA: DsbA family protein [Candidatus Baltobacteraceae bacterium]|nr:DsbA family protein [Candidatus Baltobacteraceae bacterium]
MAHVDLIYYVDVLSSWCHIADRAVEQIEQKYGESVRVDWRIAQLFDYGPLPYTREALVWYYARTAKMTGVQLNDAWHASPDTTTKYANQAAEAARALGAADSRVRRGLSRAALIEGKPLGKRDTAIAEAARLSGLPADRIAEMMESAQVAQRIAQTTQEFKDLALPQLPSFVMRNTSGDLAVFSGLYTFDALEGTIGEMLHASRVTDDFGAGP